MPPNKSQALTRSEVLARRWASVNQAAAYLGVCGKTVRAMVADGRLTGYRGLGSRMLRIDLDEVDRALEADA